MLESVTGYGVREKGKDVLKLFCVCIIAEIVKVGFLFYFTILFKVRVKREQSKARMHHLHLFLMITIIKVAMKEWRCSNRQFIEIAVISLIIGWIDLFFCCLIFALLAKALPRSPLCTREWMRGIKFEIYNFLKTLTYMEARKGFSLAWKNGVAEDGDEKCLMCYIRI